MKIIDLSTTLEDQYPTYPNDPLCTLKDYYTIDQDGYRVSLLSTNLHTGTHLDAPAHYLREGSTIDLVRIEDCIAEGIVIDVRNVEIVDKELIENKDIQNKIVLFYTEKLPVLTKECIDYLLLMKVKIIGINQPSIDLGNDELHTYCLERNLYLLENVCNLEELVKVDKFMLYVIPMKIKAEASFVRAFAICK